LLVEVTVEITLPIAGGVDLEIVEDTKIGIMKEETGAPMTDPEDALIVGKKDI